MLTNQDIKKLIKAHKEVFPTKDDFDGLRKNFSDLQTSVVAFAVGTKNNSEEIEVVNSRLKTQEGWIKQASPKIGLEYKL